MRYGQARLQEQGASDSDRYRQHHSAATPQIPDAPVQNRMCGGSYDQTGGVGPAQYTPHSHSDFSGFNPGQP